SWSYLALSLLLAAPWAAWGVSDFHLLTFAPPDKTALSPVRLLDILALMYLALSSASLRRLAEHDWARPVVACGKHSLEVFSFATLVSLVFRLLFHTFGPLWPLQVAVNVVGLGAMLALGFWLEQQRGRPVLRGAPAAVADATT
ncbi:MAG TPA: OpgC domain-containing protein, partial [Acetobacteraceae bacterium]|nr:OpgC domain-containing protein [Acetobacteraceae bacterium]